MGNALATPLLCEAVPELADALERALAREGRAALAESVAQLRIHHAADRVLYFVPPESIKRPPPARPGRPAEDATKWSYMYHPARKRHWLRVPRRRWALRVEDIDGRIAVLSVSHAGTLGPQLDALGD